MTALQTPGADIAGTATAAAGDAGEGSPAAVARVLGVDLSLTATGIGVRDQVSVLRTSNLTGLTRLRAITSAVANVGKSVDLVVIEGPSFGSKDRGFHERGGLHWMVLDALDRAGVPTIEVAPAALKKYATGKGNANKGMMLGAAIRRFDWFDESLGDDAADALWLCAFGHEHLGQPIVTLPAVQREVVAKAVTA